MSDKQAMLDRAAAITRASLAYVEGDNRNNFVILKMAMIRSLKEIALVLGDEKTYKKDHKPD